jgi:hypothetical protein
MPPSPRALPLTVARLLAAAAAVATVGVLAVALPSPAPSPPGPRTPLRAAAPAPAPAPRTPLSFVLRGARGTGLEGGPLRGPAAWAAREVGRALSPFFDAAFFDPRWWASGPPADAWAVFAPDARRAARRDGSFALGGVGTRVASLTPTRAVLRVEVLFDPAHRPLAAIAEFLVRGRGELEDGRPLALASRGTLLLRPSGGRWAVIGFPRVATRLWEPGGTGGGA